MLTMTQYSSSSATARIRRTEEGEEEMQIGVDDSNSDNRSNYEGDCDDFFVDPLEDTSHSDSSAQLCQLLNLPPSLTSNNGGGDSNMAGYPVGGMRRVSSCYFSIASNISSPNNNHGSNSGGDASMVTTQRELSIQSHLDALCLADASNGDFSSSIAATSNILFQHDILMNTFTYLDAQSLVSLSETAKRLNYECFYFLELQLQRALLVGAAAGGGCHGNSNNDDSHDNVTNHLYQHIHHDNEHEYYSMIAGTGIITRLSHLNNSHARQIVQTYLDSNTSIRGMPMLHSLSYLRQMIRWHYYYYNNNNNNNNGGGDISAQSRQQGGGGGQQQQQQQQHDGMMISTARYMALLLTLLGAAYKYQHHGGVGVIGTVGGGGDGSGQFPNFIIDEETIELAKGMMIKLGVAGSCMGSFLKAMMKEHQHQNEEEVESSVGEEMEPTEDEEDEGEQQHRQGEEEEEEEERQRQQQQQEQQHGIKVKARNMALFLTLLGAAYKVNSGEIHINEETMEVAKNMVIKLGLAGSLVKAGQMTIVNKKERGGVEQSSDGTSDGESQEHDLTDGGSHPNNTSLPRRNDRSSSMGSLEDLSNMIKNPSALASRLYNAFQSPNSSATNLGSVEQCGRIHDETTSPRKHRSKRSHTALRVDDLLESRGGEELEEKETGMVVSVDLSDAAKKTHVGMDGKSDTEPPTQEVVNYAMDHPVSSNPYDHISAADAKKKFSNDAPTATVAMTSFLPFKMSRHQAPTVLASPTGCIGAYAHAVKSAASEVTRLVKEQRKANFESLPEDEQMELGIRFIDACSSDDKIDIVKEILQKEKKMDVDRFFIGPDETETCALHAAAFNGAEKVLEFLCGGIDENDPSKDGGLCDVNVTDANGWTALHFAAGANSVLSVRILAEHGAKLTIEAGNGYTPFHWAERLSNEEVAAELGSLGADNRFVGSWMFGGSSLSFLAKRFFAFGR